jgi:hypothetical protein
VPDDEHVGLGLLQPAVQVGGVGHGRLDAVHVGAGARVPDGHADALDDGVPSGRQRREPAHRVGGELALAGRGHVGGTPAARAIERPLAQATA